MRAKDLFRGTARWVVLALSLALLLFAPLSASRVAGEPLSWPTDPTGDTNWTDTGGEWNPPGTLNATFNGVADIAAAFNNARTQENTQLGLTLPNIVMPSQAVWDTLSDGEKALWLINQERAVRGVAPLEGVEANVTTVAQWYADWLLAHDATGHSNDVDGDGTDEDPWDRMHDDPNIVPGTIAPPAITACHDFLSVGENLSYFWASAGAPAHWLALPVERAVYNWTYDDSSSAWGHRHFNLWYPFTAGACLGGVEGFIGIGRATGPHQGWDQGVIIVMNGFDPCDQWADCGPTAVDVACFKTAPVEGVGSLVGLVCLGVLAGTGFMAQHRRRKG
jgi:hypothetical protein